MNHRVGFLGTGRRHEGVGGEDAFQVAAGMPAAEFSGDDLDHLVALAAPG